MAPPPATPSRTALAVRVLFLIVMVPEFQMPPPAPPYLAPGSAYDQSTIPENQAIATLPESVQPLMVAVPFQLLSMPPPPLVAVLSLSVLLLMVIVPAL